MTLHRRGDPPARRPGRRYNERRLEAWERELIARAQARRHEEQKKTGIIDFMIEHPLLTLGVGALAVMALKGRTRRNPDDDAVAPAPAPAPAPQQITVTCPPVGAPAAPVAAPAPASEACPPCPEPEPCPPPKKPRVVKRTKTQAHGPDGRFLPAGTAKKHVEKAVYTDGKEKS